MSPIKVTSFLLLS